MFPGETLLQIEGRINAYLIEAQENVNIEDTIQADRAIKTWVYYRAFDAASTLMDTKPASSNLNDVGSRTILSEQIRSMRLRAKEFLEVFEALSKPATAKAHPFGTRAVQTRITL